VTYLRKIEIKGFKTFAERTTVTFEKGFTAITGPNGSGKTNIIDAILFGLGELSARRLRAESIAKLPFQGNPDSNLSAEKKARVVIQFDNSDGHISVDTNTATISREIDVQGQSIYRLNGRRISRGDLIDTLSTAGIAPHGYNIILQGTITHMAEISSQERRKIIEDMIGIAQYDLEKAEAQEKLKAADISVRTAMGQVGEVQKRVEDLERERNDLLRFNLIRNKMRQLEASKISYGIAEIEKKTRSLSSSVQEIEKRIQRLGDMRNSFRTKRHEAETEWRKLGSDKIEEGQTNILQIQIQSGDLRSRLSGLSTKITSEKAAADGLRRVKDNTEQQILTMNKEVDDLELKLNDLRLEYKGLSDEASAKESEYGALRDEIASLRASLNENNKLVRQKEEKLNQLYQDLINLRSDYAESCSTVRILTQRSKDVQSRKDDFFSTLERLQKSLNDLKEVRREQEERSKTLQQTLERRTARKEIMEKEMKEAGKIAETAKEAVIEFSTQRQLFERIRSEENALANIEELGEVGVIQGIYGRLRNLIKVERGYEKAIEAAAAGWLDSLVVRDLEVAFTCSETLRRLKLGRIKIIPLQGLSSSKSAPNIPETEGLKGFASAFLRYPDQYELALSFVFGDTVITSNEKSALLTSQKGLRSVTVMGDLYEVGGAVESGFYRAPMDFSSVVPTESAIKTLDQAVNALVRHIKERESSIEDVSNEIVEARVEITRLAEAANRLEGEIQLISNNIERTNQNAKRADETLHNIDESLKEEKAQIGSYRISRARILSEERRLRGELAELRKKTDMLEIQKMEVSRDDHGNEIVKLRERLGTIKTDILTMESKITNVLNAALENANIQLEKVTRQMANLEKEVERSLIEKEEVEKQIKELERKKEALSSTILGAKEEAKKFISQIESVDEQLQRVEKEYDESNLLHHQLNLDLQTLRLQMDQHLEKLKTLGYEEPLKVPPQSLQEVESSLKMMSLELERIGAVNQLAESQYAEQISRYKELSVRMNELEQEKIAIIKFIDEIERKKYNAFMDTFNRVNQNLARYFSKLTEGGEATLKLESPEDPFLGGVDMVVQFPNKPPILISGASSGERSVAAVSFLFGLQGLTPASFYIFDEVDAHLDPFHVSKLGELLMEEAAKSQFLVVTLKPEMASKAEKIYGVYGRNGVSYVIHTTLKDAG